MNRLRNASLLAGMAAVTALGCLQAVVLALAGRGGRPIDRVTARWARRIARLAGMRVEAHGAAEIDRTRSYVLVANHRSYMDTIALYLTSPVPLRMLAKYTLFRVPLFGQALRLAGHLPVHRVKGRTDMDKLRLEAHQMTAAGCSLCVFAEGKRQAVGMLAPFKRGAFALAVEMGLPILPVSIVGTGAIMPAFSFRLTPGTARLRYHPPLETAGRDIEDLLPLTRQIVAAGCRELGDPCREP